jgi:hypothetical protein
MTAARVVTAAHRRVLLLGVVGFLLFVAGLVTTLVTGAEPGTRYSGGYDPLACTGAPGCDGLPWMIGVTTGQLVGGGLAALGSVLLAGVLGWLWRDASGGS